MERSVEIRLFDGKIPPAGSECVPLNILGPACLIEDYVAALIEHRGEWLRERAKQAKGKPKPCGCEDK